MKNNISKKILRNFGILIGFAFPLIIGLILPTLVGHSFRSWTLWISFPSFILAIARPRLLHYPYIAWMKLGYILGWINSRIILGLVFLVVLQPIALVMRSFGYDPLRLKFNNFVKSYREVPNKSNIDLTRIF